VRRALAALLLILTTLVAVAGAQSRSPLTREQALADLRGPDVETRRQGAAWLGEVGTMADAPVLLGALSDADEVVRTLAEHSVWQVWSRSGDAEIDTLYQKGLQLMNFGAAGEAIQIFTIIIGKKPEFAEGWNKRATLYYSIGEYQKSLRDCDEVMKRNPLHFGALAGYGMIYTQLNQLERAVEYFKRALKINPNMQGVANNIGLLEKQGNEKRKKYI